MSADETRRVYDIHGRRLRVQAPGAHSARMLDHVFSAYVADQGAAADLEITIAVVDALVRPDGLADAGQAEDGTRFHYVPDGGVVVAVEGLGLGQIDAQGTSAYVQITVEDPDWQTGHRLVEPVVVELLRSKGLFGIHAGAVAHQGRGLLLCGRSGSGKSTAALALARSGWDFLADDTCYLDGEPAAPVVRARWSDVHLTPKSLDVVMAPEDRASAYMPTGSEKYFLPVRGLRSVNPVADCTPAWLVFPEIVDGRDAVLQPISPDEALARLIPQSLVPGRTRAARGHFDALVALCRGVRSHVLRSGQDLGAVVRAIEDLRASEN